MSDDPRQLATLDEIPLPEVIVEPLHQLNDLLAYYIQHPEDRSLANELFGQVVALIKAAVIERDGAIGDLVELEHALENWGDTEDQRVLSAKDEIWDDGYESGLGDADDNSDFWMEDAQQAVRDQIAEDMELEFRNYLTPHEADVLRGALLHPHWLHNDEEAQMALRKLWLSVSGEGE